MGYHSRDYITFYGKGMEHRSIDYIIWYHKRLCLASRLILTLLTQVREAGCHAVNRMGRATWQQIADDL